MKTTPGPWGVRGVQIRANNGLGQHIATYQTNRHDGSLIAAAPQMLQLLLDACSSLDACESGSRSHCTADRIRSELAELKLITLGKDERGNPSEREDPADTVLP